MYTKITVLNRVLENADRFVKDNDRDMYAPYFRAVEEYISERGFYLGGDAGNNLLIHSDEPNFRYNREIVSYEIHCTDAGRHMQALAEILYKTHNSVIPRDTIFGETIVRGLEYKISINTRDIVLIHAFRLTNSLEDMVKIVPPVERVGPYSKKTIRCIPGTPHLLAILRRLYTPYSAEYKHTYTHYLSMVRDIWKNVDMEFDRVLEARGGGEPLAATTDHLLTSYSGECCGDHKSHHTGGHDHEGGGHGPMKDERLIDTFIKRKLAGLKNTILIGDYALAHLPDKQLSAYKPTKWRLQLISDNSAAEVMDVFKSIDPSLTYSYGKFPSVDTSDFQTTKFTINFESSNGKKIHLCDVFNNASFELVPFKEYHGVKVGGPFVLLRFKLIDIWTLTLIRDTNLHGRIIDNIRQSRMLFKYVYDMVEASPSEVFQLQDYIGVYIDRSVELKRILGKSRFNIPRYFPSLVKTVSTEEATPVEPAPMEVIEGAADTPAEPATITYKIPTIRQSSVYLSSSRTPQYTIAKKFDSADIRSRSVPYKLESVPAVTVLLEAEADKCNVVAGRKALCEMVFGIPMDYQVDVRDGTLYIGPTSIELDPIYTAVASSIGLCGTCKTTFIISDTRVLTDGLCGFTDVAIGGSPEYNWLHTVLGGGMNICMATVTATEVLNLERIPLSELVTKFKTTTPTYLLFALDSALKWLLEHVTGPGILRIGPDRTMTLTR